MCAAVASVDPIYPADAVNQSRVNSCMCDRTHEALLVIGYISNLAEAHSWDELISFWEEEAGPFPLD